MLKLSRNAFRQLSAILRQLPPAWIEELLRCFHSNRVECFIEALYPAPAHSHEHMLFEGLQQAGIATPPDNNNNNTTTWGG